MLGSQHLKRGENERRGFVAWLCVTATQTWVYHGTGSRGSSLTEGEDDAG